MTLFISLLLAHFIADFYLQPHSWIMDKVKYKQKSFGLFKHICVHVVLTAAMLSIFIPLSTNLGIALAVIIISHYLIDIWKTHMGFTFKFFIMDQLGHVLVIALISLWLSGINLSLTLNWITENLDYSHLLIILAYLIAFKPISLIIQLLLRPYTEQFESAHQDEQGLKTAGEYIGALERTLVITFVLIDQFAGIGFLLAAKSVFRFGDMRRQQDRKLTEYIMLGTLLSFSCALLLGLLVKQTL